MEMEYAFTFQTVTTSYSFLSISRGYGVLSFSSYIRSSFLISFNIFFVFSEHNVVWPSFFAKVCTFAIRLSVWHLIYRSVCPFLYLILCVFCTSLSVSLSACLSVYHCAECVYVYVHLPIHRHLFFTFWVLSGRTVWACAETGTKRVPASHHARSSTVQAWLNVGWKLAIN